MSRDLDLEVPRNGNYYQEWQLCDSDGEPINLTGATLAMDCRAIAGDTSVIASAAILLVEPLNGQFTVNWDGSDFDNVEGKTEIVRLAYDLKRIAGGIAEIPVRGHIVLMPEVTQ